MERKIFKAEFLKINSITQMAFGLPSTWASNIETVIFEEVQRMAKQAGVLLSEYK